jgi:hypothetical protein
MSDRHGRRHRKVKELGAEETKPRQRTVHDDIQDWSRSIIRVSFTVVVIAVALHFAFATIQGHPPTTDVVSVVGASLGLGKGHA